MPGKKRFIYQTSAGQAISSDGNFLVETVLKNHPQENLKVLDLGCGCGILAFMLKLARPFWDICGVDIQANLIQLAKKNAQICQLETNFICQDLNSHRQKYDLVVCNPPFFPVNSGKMPQDQGKQIARFEIKCTQEQVLDATERCLSPGGSGYALYPLARLQNHRLRTKIVATKRKVGVVKIDMQKLS